MKRTAGTVHGRLDGRERHVLPDLDGTRRYPVWLDGLDHQRAWVDAQAAEILRPRLRALPDAVPVLARVGVALVASSLGGVDALAPRLRTLFVRLGPTFVKFGQLISGGTGLFPQRLVEEFESFRDRVPPEPFDHVRQVLAEEIPGGIDAFASFDREPLAAASIAQVHAATLPDGRAVVVKVQRPGIAAQVRHDLKWISTLADLLDRFVPPARAGNLPGIIEYFTETLMEELDFRLEAENQLDVSEAVGRSDAAAGVAVPRPHPTLVTRRVLVMERFEGFDSTDAAGMTAAGIDTAELVSAGFAAFAEGALVWGVFHGDLHPGNIMVLADGRYAILDYGIVGRLSPVERSAFAAMMAAASVGDVKGQLAAFRDMGAFPPDVDLDDLVTRIDPAMLPTELRIPDMANVTMSMQESLRLVTQFHFRLPKLLVLLTKNLIFADDACRRLAPDLDLMAEAAPLAMKAMQTAPADA